MPPSAPTFARSPVLIPLSILRPPLWPRSSICSTQSSSLCASPTERSAQTATPWAGQRRLASRWWQVCKGRSPAPAPALPAVPCHPEAHSIIPLPAAPCRCPSPWFAPLLPTFRRCRCSQTSTRSTCHGCWRAKRRRALACGTCHSSSSALRAPWARAPLAIMTTTTISTSRSPAASVLSSTHQ